MNLNGADRFVRLPRPLPIGFVEDIGYVGDSNVVAMHWVPKSVHFVVYDAHLRWDNECQERPLQLLLREPWLRLWVQEFDVKIGPFSASASWHLVVWRDLSEGAFVVAELARQIVAAQYPLPVFVR